MRAALLLAPLLSVAASGGAQMAAPMPMPSCTAAAPLPAAYASFAHPVPAAQDTGVFLGKAARLDLGPGAYFAVKPGHVPATGTFGGSVGFDVIDAGTYRVATGAPVWIDVVRGTTAIASVAHQQGPACSGVRKLVDFTLTPGHYTLQISGSATTSITFQVAKAP